MSKHDKKTNKSKNSSSDDSSDSSDSSDGVDEKIRDKLKKMKKKLKREERKTEKRLKKKLKKEKKKLKKEKRQREKLLTPKICNDITPVIAEPPEKTSNIPIGLMEKSKAMAPMTKEEWEKRQSVVRKVLDEESGRYRLIKGDGEVLEEIVSQKRHKEINKQATRADGAFYATVLGKEICK